MKCIISYSLICLALLNACKNNNNASNANPQARATMQTVTNPLSFKLPAIPLLYTEPEQRAEYLASHYWDHFNFTDTLYISNDVTEQAFVDFIDILNHVPLDKAREAINKTIKHAEERRVMFDYFIELAEKYLRDPNSPARNEELFIPVLERMIASDSLTDTEKIRPANRLNLALKNRVGTKAQDFTYTLASGKQAKLHHLKSDFIVLYFNNPGCHTCELYTEKIRNSMRINDMLKQNRLTILAVYPDEDIESWKEHLPEFPPNWINGYDKELAIQTNDLYDLKAIPTLYLLSRDKTVLLKDVTFEDLEAYFF